MGMFDYLRCEMPLPVDWPNEGFQFQTKDTDAQYMERYTITADGRLMHHAVRYEDTPQAELPYPDAEPGSWQSICGIIRSVPTGDVEVPMHGDIGFHDLAESGAWVGLIARFTEGRCVRIWCDELRPPTKREVVATLDDAMPTEGKIAALKAAGFLFREGCDTPENAHAAGKVTIEKDDVSETTRYRMWVPLPASGIEIPKGPVPAGPAEGESPAIAEGDAYPIPRDHHDRSGTGSEMMED